MKPFARVSPRRLTGKEEAELLALGARVKAADDRAAELHREQDRLILDIADAGARVTDIADVLGIDRQTVYNAMRRAKRA